MIVWKLVTRTLKKGCALNFLFRRQQRSDWEKAKKISDASNGKRDTRERVVVHIKQFEILMDPCLVAA